MDVFGIYKDKKQARFWEKAGEEFGHLHWVRAMISKDADERVEVQKINVPGNYFELSGTRAGIYGLLARGYREPEPGFAGEVSGAKVYEKLKKYFSIVDIDTGGIDKIIDGFKRFEHYNHSDMLGEYTEIFLEPSLPFIPAYESIYISEKQVMGNTTIEVQKFYENNGFETSTELPDHISNELEFMEFLCKKNNKEIQKKFLDSHLLGWAHNFCGDLSAVAKSSGSKFYLNLSEITNYFMGMEHNL